MRYTFIHLRLFSSLTRYYQLSQEDLRDIENTLMQSPTAWPVVPGTGGIRKMRFAPGRSGAGKRGALRICYLAVPEHFHIYLFTMYAKNEAKDLTPTQKKQIAALVRDIQKLYVQRN